MGPVSCILDCSEYVLTFSLSESISVDSEQEEFASYSKIALVVCSHRSD